MEVLSKLRDPTSRLAKTLSGLLALLLFGFLFISVISGFLLYQILRPTRTSTTFDLSVMMGHPTKFSFPANGAMRDGWFFPGLRAAPTVVVCHGYHSQRADVLTLVSALQDHGFNVFTFDFTGHGSSPGVTTLGYGESDELRSAVEALAKRDDVDRRRFGLWGVDMGGYAVAEVAESSPRIAAFAVDDAYADPRDMVQIQVAHSGLAVLPLVGHFSDFEFRVLNYSFRDQPTVSARLWKTAGTPKLFIQSEDHLELADDTLKMFAAAPGPKQIVSDSLSYSDMSDDDRRNYESLIANFFLKNIPPVSAP
ncbi:MAG: alpha/beta fold hydrolase [Candidatus Acidiferrales bacterium]